MIADDMMSYIKSDIAVFGIGVFFIVLTLWFIFRDIKMGGNAIIRMCFICNHNDWATRFNWMESNSYFIKFYCLNAYFKHGDEYSFNCQISSTKKRVFLNLQK